jgi:transposase
VLKRLKWIPGHFEVEEHRRHVYGCAECNEDNARGTETPTVIVRADMPHAPIDKAMATASTIAFIICEKYAYSKPLYRIETTFAHGGVALSRATMCNWVITVATRWFALIRERMRRLLLAQDVIHCDETWVQVLKEPGRAAQTKSYMWVFATPECTTRQIVLFEYHSTRAADVPKAFFKDWEGYVQCDGYDAYHNLGENITVAGCLAHVRRKYMDIAKSVGINKLPASCATATALRHLRKIFDTERTFAELTPDERKGARARKLAPLLDDFFAWAKDTASEAVGKTAIKDALQYTVNQETYIRNILKDGRLDLTNNSCERRIRPFAIARRNNLFSDTPRGADASAVLFSVVQSALANGLKPYEYLTWVLEGLPNAAPDADPGVIDDYLPWSAKIPECFKMNSKERSSAAKEPVLLSESVDVSGLERVVRDQERLIQSAEQS